MKILITSAQSPLGAGPRRRAHRNGGSAPAGERSLRPPGRLRIRGADHLNPASLEPAVAGVDAVVHTGELPLTPAPGRWRKARLVHPRDLRPDGGRGSRGSPALRVLRHPRPVRPLPRRGLHNRNARAVSAPFRPDHVALPSPSSSCGSSHATDAITCTSLRLGTLTFEEEADAAVPDYAWLDPPRRGARGCAPPLPATPAASSTG